MKEFPKKLKLALSWRGEPLSCIAERQNCITYNFVSEDFEDFKVYGFDISSCVLIHSKFNWANIVSHIGLFPSAGQAKKSGWDIPIENGYTEAFFSKSDGTPLFVFIFKTDPEYGKDT